MNRSGQHLHSAIALLLFLLIALFVAPVQAQDPTGSSIRIFLPLIYNAEPPVWLGPYGGSVICLAQDPTNASIVFAGTLNGGVFKSTDRGNTWRAVNNGLGGLFIDSLAVDPTNGNTVYAGTHGQGVYKSTDGGANWFAVNNGIANQSVVYTLAVNPSNPKIVFAGTRIQGTFTGILYRSLNGGASWETVMYHSDDWVYSVAISPSSPNLVMAAVHTGGPQVSSEYGAPGTWKPGEPPASFNDYARERWRKGRAVAFDPRPGSGRAHYTAWHDGFVFYSTNNGAKWNLSGGSLGGAQVYPNGISIKPGNADIIYLADHDRGTVNGVMLPGTIMRSTNGGLTYQPTNLTRVFYSVAALSGSGDTVLAGTYMDGIWKSDNGGASWYPSMTGLVNSYVTGLVFSDSNTWYASTMSGGGVFRSTDGGASWTLFNSGLRDTNVNGLVMHPANPNVIFALTNSGGLQRLDLRAGNNWSAALLAPAEDAIITTDIRQQQISTTAEIKNEMIDPGDETLFALGMSPTVVSAPVLTLAFAPSNANIAYAGTNGAGVYASSDGGMNWSPVGLKQTVVRWLAVSPTNPKRVIAATNEPGVVKISEDGGVTWSTAHLPDRAIQIYSVVVAPGNPEGVYFGTSNGVMRYTGSGWSHMGLGGYQVFALGYHPAAAQRLVAGTQAGGFVATSGQANWSSIAGELADKSVVSLNFDPHDARYVYVGTEYNGTLRVPLGQ